MAVKISRRFQAIKLEDLLFGKEFELANSIMMVRIILVLGYSGRIIRRKPC